MVMYPPVPRPQSHTGAIIAAVLIGVWLVIVAMASQLIMWLVTQVLIATGLETPVYVWPITALVLVLLAGLPAILLLVIAKHAPSREAGRVWTIGAGALTVGSALRAIPGTENDWLLLAMAVLAGIGALLVRRRRQEPEPPARPEQQSAPPAATPAPVGPSGDGTPPGWWLPPPPNPYFTPTVAPPPPPKPVTPPAGPFPAAAGWGIVAGVLVLIPFLWVGALGGWLETFLAILAAAAIGALAASTLDYRFWTVYDQGTARRVLLGGLTGGTALALFAGGTGGNGVQVLLLLFLPPLAFAAAALKRAWPLVGVAVLGPLALIDPVEMVPLLLQGREVPYWAMMASLAGLGIALVVGLVYAFGVFKTPRALAFGTAAVLALAGGAVYAGAGQPGFFGDQLFVVMKDQAPLAGLPTITGLGPGRDARVSAVYQRLVEHANRTQASLRGELDRWKLRYRPYYLVNAIRVDGGPEIRAWLETRGDVDRVLLDQRLRPLPADPADTTGGIGEPPSTPEWNIRMVGAPDAWRIGATGKGIVVGSSDSGADGKHPALSGNFRGGDDSWYDPWNDTLTPNDSGGHGTHTLATAVGRQNVGVAPDAQWISCVNLDRNLGSPSLYLECLQFMLAPFPAGGDPFKDGRPNRAPHVLTNSWGCPPLEGCDLGAMRPATNALAAAGIAFVAAAGNTGSRCGSIEDPPAPDPATLTIAAVDQSQSVTDFSSRGEPGSNKPDVAAPGANILSAMPGNTYATLDGTSMATPHAAGVVALLWSARPELVGNLQTTYSRIKSTATPVVGGKICGGTADAGAGIVNARQAIGSGTIG